MNDNVMPHPKRGLMIEANRELEVAHCPEARALQEAIFKAVTAYEDFLLHHNIIIECSPNPGDRPRLKATALVVTRDFVEDYIDISLKDGAVDRVYSNGVDPDP